MKRFFTLVAGLAMASLCLGANYIGDYAPGDTVDCNFTTYRPSTGATFTLGGTPAISAYKDNSTTQSTSGITLSADFDSVTGLNHVRVTTGSDGTFYSAGSFFDLVITTGTVDSVSVTGSTVCSFSLNKVSSLRPATAGRTLVVDAAGLADANTVKLGPSGSGTAQTARDIGASVLLSNGTGTGQVSLSSGTVTAGAISSGAITATAIASDAITAAKIADGAIDEATFATTAGSFKPLGIIDQGTAQAATSTTVQLRSAAAFGDDTILGATIVACGSTQGYCQAGVITDYVGSTDTATVATWGVTPSGTVTYYVFGTAPASGSGGSLTAADVWAYGTRTITGTGTGAITSSSFAAGAIDASAIAADAIGASEIATDAIGAAEIAANAIGAAEVADATIDAATFAAGAIDASAIATDAIGAAEIATDAIGAAEIAASAIGSSELADGGITSAEFGSGAITATVIATDAIGAAELASDAGTEIGAAVNTATGTITGTCSSGSTTTCVDAALTQAAASQLEGRLICFSDSWCALITTFNPATDTATTTKTAPSTRASKTYTIFPATVE